MCYLLNDLFTTVHWELWSLRLERFNELNAVEDEESQFDVSRVASLHKDWSWRDWAAMSSRSQRPLKRNFDLSVNKRLELLILGTSTPRLKLKKAFWSRMNFHKCLHIRELLHLKTITCFLIISELSRYFDMINRQGPRLEKYREKLYTLQLLRALKFELKGLKAISTNKSLVFKKEINFKVDLKCESNRSTVIIRILRSPWYYF